MSSISRDKALIKQRLAEMNAAAQPQAIQQREGEIGAQNLTEREISDLGQDPGFLSPQSGGASFGQGLGAIASGMADQLVGATQGTSPNVRDIQGNLLRVPLGPFTETDTGPAVRTQQGTIDIDPNKMVVLRDPADGQLKVFPRDPEFEEGGLMSAGRAASGGLISGPLLRGAPSALSRAAQPFQDAGVGGTFAQQSGGAIARGTQAAVSRLPGTAGPFERAAERVRTQIADRVSNIASSLTKRPTAEAAGRAIERGILGEGGFVSRFKDRGRALFGALDDQVPATSQVSASNVLKAGDDLSAVIEGAEQSSSVLANARTREVVEAIRKDAQGGRMPFRALQSLRTKIGEQLAGAPVVGDVPRGQLKKLYAALTDDLKAAAEAQGPEATRAFQRANNFWRAGIERIDDLNAVVQKAEPEKIFQAALQGTKEGGTRIRRVLRSLKPQERDAVVGAILQRMGRASGGVTEAADDAFSVNTFLTNYNNLSKEARDALFAGARSVRFRRDLDTIVDVAQRVRRVERTLPNPSGTAQASIKSGTLGAFLISAITGQFQVAGAIVGGVGASNMAARLITYPPFVRWLATAQNIPVSRAPQHIAQLNAVARGADAQTQEAIQGYIASLQASESRNQDVGNQ